MTQHFATAWSAAFKVGIITSVHATNGTTAAAHSASEFGADDEEYCNIAAPAKTEVSCHMCFGWGHIQSACPSPKKARSLKDYLAHIQLKVDRGSTLDRCAQLGVGVGAGVGSVLRTALPDFWACLKAPQNGRQTIHIFFLRRTRRMLSCPPSG